MLSLRLTNGLSIDKLKSLDASGRFCDIVMKAERINKMSYDKLINISEDKKNISLTENGFLLSNTIISQLL